MIEVRLFDGRILRFPDNTPEAVMRRAAEEVQQGAHDRNRDQQMDLSHLRRDPDTYDLSHLKHQVDTGTGTAKLALEPELSRLTPEQKREQMQFAREHGDIGHIEGGTPERSPVRRAIDEYDGIGSMPLHAVSDAFDVAQGITRSLPGIAKVAGSTAADVNVGAARLPEMALRGARAVGRKFAEPYDEVSGRDRDDAAAKHWLDERGFPTTGRDPLDTGLGAAQEMTGGWRDDATRELAESSQDLPTPIAAGLFHGATTAGMLADASQWVGAGSKPFGAGRGAMTEAEQQVANLAGRSQQLPDDITDLARRSLDIEPPASPTGTRIPVHVIDDGTDAGGIVHKLAAVDADGNQVGSMMYGRDHDGGFRVLNVETGARGTGVGRAMYREAFDREGPYRGGIATTPEGEGFVGRLRETDPDIFGAGRPPAIPFRRSPGQFRAPIVGVQRYDDDSLVLSFGVDEGKKVTADDVRGLFPDLPANYRISLAGANNELRPNLQRVKVTFWSPNDLRNGAGRIVADDFEQRLGGATNPTGIGVERSLGNAADSMASDLGIPPRLPGMPETLLPTPSEQSARLAAAERGEFLRPPLPFKPTERGSIGSPGSPGPKPTPPLPNDIPEHLRPQLPEEQVAESMGWKPPTGTPSVTGPPIVTPDFQTNLASQIGVPESDEVANYIVRRSDEVFKAIGPPQSWDTLEEMAARLGTTKDEFLSRSSHWSVLPPEARLRLTYVIKGNEQQIGGLQSKLVSGAATDADKTELLRLIDTREDLIKLGAQTGSAYGRALNSLKIEARLALGDDVLLRQKLYRQYAKQLDNEKPLMSVLARLDPNKPEELQAFLRAVNRPKWYEYAHEYWVSSILSAPTSHLRNLIGNSVNAVMENAVVRPVSAGFDAARVAGTGAGTAGREIFLRETPAAVVGLGLGIRQGLRRGLEVIKRGYDPIAMQGKLFPVRSAFARSQNRVVREVVGPVVTMPLRMLAASDALFKTMNWTAEVYAQAARIATKEGLSGPGFAARTAELIGNPTDDMISAADAFALKATFNDEASAIGKAVMGLRDLPGVSSANPGLQAGIETYRAGMGFILPFVKIADRLMVRGFEYTPLGVIPAIGARRAGNFVQAADYAARASVGSAILAYAASLAMEGRLTAGAPSDEAEKAASYAANKQPWAARTEDGVWIPFAGLQPIGTAFALAAAAWKGWAEHEESPDIEKLGHAAAQIGAYVTDQSYMDGLAKFMDAVSGSERDRGRAFSDLTTNTAWGFAPYSGLTRSVTRAIDPRVIDAETIGERLKQNVPGVSLSMDARLTPWGEDVVPTGGRLRPILPPGTPLLPSQERKDPLDEELSRLGMPLGYVGKTIADRFGEGKSRGQWKLSQQEWYLYQQTAGKATKLMLERLFAKPGYPEWDLEVQRDRTSAAIEAARKYARIVMVRYHRGQGIPGMNPRYGDINAAANPPTAF